MNCLMNLKQLDPGSTRVEEVILSGIAMKGDADALAENASLVKEKNPNSFVGPYDSKTTEGRPIKFWELLFQTAANR